MRLHRASTRTAKQPQVAPPALLPPIAQRAPIATSTLAHGAQPSFNFDIANISILPPGPAPAKPSTSRANNVIASAERAGQALESLAAFERKLLGTHWHSDAERRLYTQYFLMARYRAATGEQLDGDALDEQLVYYENLVTQNEEKIAELQVQERDRREREEAEDEVKRLVAEDRMQRKIRSIGSFDVREHPVLALNAAAGASLGPLAETAELMVGFLPVVGQLVLGLEVLLGRQVFTGRELSRFERGFGALLLALPCAGAITRAGKAGARAIVYVAERTGQNALEVLRIMRGMTNLSEETVRLAQRATHAGHVGAEELTAFREIESAFAGGKARGARLEPAGTHIARVGTPRASAPPLRPEQQPYSLIVDEPARAAVGPRALEPATEAVAEAANLEASIARGSRGAGATARRGAADFLPAGGVNDVFHLDHVTLAEAQGIASTRWTDPGTGIVYGFIIKSTKYQRMTRLDSRYLVSLQKVVVGTADITANATKVTQNLYRKGGRLILAPSQQALASAKLAKHLSERFGRLSLLPNYKVLSAHGHEVFAAGGTFRVPPGTRLVIWQGPGVTMDHSLGQLLEQGLFPIYEPFQILKSGDVVPEIVLSSLGSLRSGNAANIDVIRVAQRSLLSSHLTPNMGDVHLGACREFRLPPSPSLPSRLPPMPDPPGASFKKRLIIRKP